MLRISINKSEGNVVTLQLEGDLVAAWVSELSETCERMLSAGHNVILDLGGVSLIERHGFKLLVSLSRRGVALDRCSPFQQEQLRITASTQPNAPNS
ncbi:MAG: STAS domain-containing protein [Chthoniobacterales bacterium]